MLIIPSIHISAKMPIINDAIKDDPLSLSVIGFILHALLVPTSKGLVQSNVVVNFQGVSGP